MAKILVLRNNANEKIGEMEVTEKPAEKSIIQFASVSYRVFRIVEPSLQRGSDIVYRAVVNPV
jgi:hypothetical protein